MRKNSSGAGDSSVVESRAIVSDNVAVSFPLFRDARINMASHNREHPVGIDLGTTFSAIAYLDATGRPETIPNAEGAMITPSAVFFDKEGPIVGVEALRAGEFEPGRLAQFAKRDMGELTFHKWVRGVPLPPEVIQAFVLKKVKADAERKIGPIRKAVVTVPAFFNEPCRKATMDAGRLADLEVVDIINEPTAAAITYGFDRGFLTGRGESQRLERILVFDLGGGTFDVTIMEIDGPQYTAIATAGDVYLGGFDWDSRLAAHIAETYREQFDVEVSQDPVAMQTLLRIANETKHALSVRKESQVFFNHEGQRLKTSVSREQFEELTSDLLDRTMMTVKMLMSEAAFAWSDITRVLLVGGSTRMPIIEETLSRETSIPIDRSVSADEAVAHGAALYAGLLMQSPEITRFGMSLTNVNSHDLSVLGIERATNRPRKRVMIPRNTQLPAKRSHTFKTKKDNQPNVRVDIIEGGDDSGQNSIPIGKCVVSDLPAGLPKGSAVEVEFEYQQNGRLLVRAWLPNSDRQATFELDRAAGLTDEALIDWKRKIEGGMPDEDHGDRGSNSGSGDSDEIMELDIKPDI